MPIPGQAALEACPPEYIPAYKVENLPIDQTAAVDHQILRSIASLAAISTISYCHTLKREVNPPPGLNCSYISRGCQTVDQPSLWKSAQQKFLTGDGKAHSRVSPISPPRVQIRLYLPMIYYEY